MSRYHSICETCGFEDPNDGSIEEDCGHHFFVIIDHVTDDPEHDDPPEEDEDEDFVSQSRFVPGRMIDHCYAEDNGETCFGSDENCVALQQQQEGQR